MTERQDIAAIAIGRNEGERLIACLESLAGKVGRIVYVDSGSTDGSREAARARGAEVVELDLTTPFTAARARNAGIARLTGDGSPPPTYVQFLDGDCTLQPDWIETAASFLDTHPEAAIACGRRRERFPEASIYNRLIDLEWDTPIGRVQSCGGDALIRTSTLQSVGGYNPDLIAGEEPELCLRLRRAGWEIWRLDAEMTLHDAALRRFGQWWQRARRGGYAFAEAVAMYGRSGEHRGWHNLKHILAWGIALPAATLIGTFLTPWALVLLIAWPAQVMRRLLRGDPWYEAVYVTLAKLPEAQGVLTYLWRRLTWAKARLIEYK